MELELALLLLKEHPHSSEGRGKTPSFPSSYEQILATLNRLFHVNEVLQPEEQAIFTAHVVPWCLNVMSMTPVKFSSKSDEHRVRNGVLLVLKTLTGTVEPMRPFLEDLMNLMLEVLRDDNEENAILAIHFIIDAHKIHRHVLEPFAQPVVDYVLSAFESFSDICSSVFETAKREEKGGTSSRRGSTRPEGDLLKATLSFKVLIESPVLIVLLFQIHRRIIPENIGKFAPQVIQSLSIGIPQPTTSVPSNITGLALLSYFSPLQTAFSDYISAQVKTLSFLAYISRGFSALIRPHYGLIPVNVIRLLRDCPPDNASARKELLVATRHILSTEIRQAFVPFLGDLLDESLLLGDGFTSRYVLRPLALSMLADLVHHVRAEIPMVVLSRIIQLYSHALHDPTLPVGVQTMSAKLLVNVADSLLSEELGNLQDRRKSLLNILWALLSKFDWIAAFVEDMKNRPDPRHYAPYFEAGPDASLRPIDTDVIAMDPNRDNFRDFKFLIKTLIGGLKNVLFALKTVPVKDENGQSAAVFTVEEGRDFVDLFKDGVRAFDIFRLADEHSNEKPTASSPQSGGIVASAASNMPDALLNVVSVQSEEKEIYEQFAYLFTLLDTFIFQEVFTYHLAFLVEAMAKNHSLLIIPQYLLAISGISRNFSGLLMRYLMDRFDDLVSPDLTRGAICLRLFKLLFLAVSVYPDDNEGVLQPYLTEILMNCLKRHQHTTRSLNYFLLLRSLFRSIGGGRFDALYKEVLPLLSVILEELGKLPLTTSDPVLRELYVELCLTTPVRLSVLLPYLSHLMRPLVLALKSSPELVSQGLRTLELCIDNLTQDFLEPIVYPILGELLECLWALLRPPPANQAHSHAAMRILGKMGGRSHRYIPLPKPQPYIEHPEDSRALRLALSWDGGHAAELPLDALLATAARVLSPNATASPEQRLRAYELIEAAVRTLFRDQVASSADPVVFPFESQLVSNPNVSSQCSENVSERLAALNLDDRVSGSKQRGGHAERLSRPFCENVLRALFHAATTHGPELGEKAASLLIDFFTVTAASITKPGLGSSLLPPPEVFFDALVDTACSVASTEDSVWELIVSIVKRLHEVNGLCGAPRESPVLSLLLEKLITACYRVPVKDKIQVVRLVNVLRGLESLDLTWLWVYEVRLARGILYAMKSLNPGQVSLLGSEMTEVLLRFLRLCNSRAPTMNESSEDVARRTQFFNQLVTLLVSEVSNPNALVRSAVQGCFQLLADVTGSDVTELLLPLKERLLAPIFTKPLRALPPNLQIGYIDAITYCLSLRPPLLEVNDELLRLLNEAIALSEADDTFLASKTNQLSNAENILQLRLACIRLLSTALSTAEFGLPKLQPVRNMIVAVFFKALYARAPDVVEASRVALEQVMVNQHKLPKDLLQTALRPVLTNLAEAKRLTLPGLEGLRRVLELLTSYFKAEIGKKLLDHLAAWAEPKKVLQDAADRPLCESAEVRVIAAILDIFHLLPPSGHVFVAELVGVVVNLESLVLRGPSSPFRLPLQRLLTHYPAEAVEHLLGHLKDSAVVALFSHVASMAQSEALIEALIPNLPRFTEAYAGSSDVLACDILGLIRQCLLSDYLSAEDGSRLLESLWGIASTRPDAPSSVREFRFIFTVACRYLALHGKSLPSLAFLPIRIAEKSYLACSKSLPMALRPCLAADGLISSWVAFHTGKEDSATAKIQAIRFLLLPALGRLRLEHASGRVPSALVETVISALACPQPKVLQDGFMLAVEEVQVASFLLQEISAGRGGDDMADQSCRDRLEQLLLSKAVHSDPSVRFAAYCGVTKALEGDAEMQSKGSSAVQPLLTLLPSVLKMPTSETRPVVRQALDLLLRALIPAAKQDERVVAQIAEHLLASLHRESYSNLLVSAKWQCLVGLPGEEAVLMGSALQTLLASSFLRSAQAVFLVADFRGLPFEVLKIFCKLPASCSPNTYSAISRLSMKLLLSMAMTEEAGSAALQKAIEAYCAFVRVFAPKDAALPWIGLDRLFAATPATIAAATAANGASSTQSSQQQQPGIEGYQEEQLIPNQRSALRLIKALLLNRSAEEQASDLVIIGPALAPLVRQSPPALCTELLDVLAYASHCPIVEAAACDGLITGRLPAAALHVAVLNEELLVKDERAQSALTRILPRLTREYLSKHEAALGPSSSAGTNALGEAEFQAKYVLIPALKALIPLANKAVEAVRPPILLTIGLVWERGLDRELLLFLVDLFIGWISGSEPPLFTLKELTTVLLTPNRIEQLRGDEALLNRYLDLVLTIYQCPGLKGSELTNRLEGSFLQGLALPGKRAAFMALLDESIAKPIATRLQYLLGGVRWALGGSQFYWIPMLVHLVIRASDSARLLSPHGNRGQLDERDQTAEPSVILAACSRLKMAGRSEAAMDFLEGVLFHDDLMARQLWLNLFPSLWSSLSAVEREGVSKALSRLLASQEGLVSHPLTTNPLATILTASSLCSAGGCGPRIVPHLLRYTAQNHKTWYSSLLLLEDQQMAGASFDKEETARVTSLIYSDLGEADMMYGILRRSCTLPESASCLSFAEASRWSLAQQAAEQAQEAARAGALPYLDSELSTWEAVWLDAAKKLQQWDLVTEVAKVDGDAELNLECIWRLGDWLQGETVRVADELVGSLPGEGTARSKFIHSFILLNNLREQSSPDRSTTRFQSSLEEAIQSSLQSWNLLPDFVSRTHVGLLHQFQMFVEIQEAMTIYGGIAGGASNPASLISRPQFLTDLKGLLSTWRERLPNRMDDLNIWSDLLAWRQHIFSALNSAFQTPAGPAPAGPGAEGAAAPPSHPFAYRGYHELAWLINKFSRVCRKNGLPEACLSFLNRIYTLPNIEIQDAFSKLREQTLCYLDTPSDLPTALEVINATNLNYFSSLQKAEFFATKGLILSKLGMAEEANRVFAQAVQIDLNIGKGWAYWGQFNDQRFQQTHDITLAVSAINCYLQASTLFKITKARRFAARILWLLTFEDAAGSMAKSFELYNNDLPVWFWVTFIPQLLGSLARKEARLARFLLIKLAKSFPQALYLALRTAADEYRIQFGANPPSAAKAPPPAAEEPKKEEPAMNASVGQPSQEIEVSAAMPANAAATTSAVEPRRSPVEYTEDLLGILKTGYPLLSLSMENMVEHIVQRLRSTADEDLYRVIVTLLSEAFQQMMIRFNSAAANAEGSGMPAGNGMESSLKRVSFMLGSSPYLASTYKKAFDQDFVAPTAASASSLDDIIALLQTWRANLERVISRCPASFSLESLSRFLAEFEHQRYDEVEVPGQYQQLRDNNNDFVKIERFEPIVDIVRRHGSSFRRIGIRGSTGEIFRFVVQNPSARQSRREEKIMDFFRSIKRGLKQNPNSRRRGLDFAIHVIVPISAHVRLIQDELDQVTLEEAYEDFCRQHQIGPEDVLIHYRDAFQSELQRRGVQLRKGNVEVLNLRVDLFQDISRALVPSDILDGYVRRMSPTPDKYWLFRQTFARQYACSLFLAYVMALGHRYPHKLAFSRRSATLHSTEILPTLNPNGQITLVEAVPFRLTPNLQAFISPLLVEGVLTPALYSCAEVFYKPDSEFSEYLPMIIRDELVAWVLLNQPAKPRFAPDPETGQPAVFKNDLEILEQLGIDERQFLGRVIQNCELAMKRCQTLACIKETEKVADGKTCAYQTIIDLISCATNPQKLALMDAHWHPWL